jgi:hypothetical protein
MRVMDNAETNEADDRRATLTRIWMASAKALATILEETPAADLQAAVLQAARQFLSDNNVDVSTLTVPDEQRKHMAALYAHLPKFDDDYSPQTPNSDNEAKQSSEGGVHPSGEGQ